MESIKQALAAIKAGGRPAEILQEGIDRDRHGFVAGLGAFVAAALDGVVPDPENL